ncbi:plasmid mobilization relaxosome protein MobC [Bradyrhizobium sp. Ec3.3]|uniref:plasmid mobilization protein n=1 Tax=Bradyrhizobium sp. Ec3.3 TaxID=189753 RepID=UPI0018DB2E2F|nr:plasmid mobilization relaxosome protein MobC [Bradyrhizobium sp. Ec3.3]
MVRPRVPDPRNKQLKLYFTAGELASIEKRAQALGMRPVHFGRAVLLSDGRIVIPRDHDADARRQVLSHLSRLGNNLNQMVRHLHATGDPLPADLEPLLIDIRRIIARGNSR